MLHGDLRKISTFSDCEEMCYWLLGSTYDRTPYIISGFYKFFSQIYRNALNQGLVFISLEKSANYFKTGTALSSLSSLFLRWKYLTN